jgi:hypothetical protein
MGALASARVEQRWDPELSALMYEALGLELDGCSLTEFNHRAESSQDVVELFQRTASGLRKR